MNNDAQYIFIADYVPIENKGEEAIVRGIEDMLRIEDRPVEIGLFGPVKHVTRHENITVFPCEWVYRVSGKTQWPEWRRILVNILISLQMKLGYYSRMTHIVSGNDRKYRELREFFDKSEVVLVGHDAVFCAESCGVIHLARKAGKRMGILGSGIGITWRGKLYQKWLYRRAMEESDFCVFRERTSYESMKSISKNPERLILAPDPAFYMKPASSEKAQEILGHYEEITQARESQRSIVAATVLETGIVYQGFMPHLDPESKKKPHAKYLATIFDTLIRERNVFVVFLPHSIETHANDVVAAEHVRAAMTHAADNTLILNEDLSPRVLKGMIRECDFLVGERAHSLIGSVSVATPFVALTNRIDYRMHGILGEMCEAEGSIVNIDVSSSEEAARKVVSIFDNRESAQASLESGKQKRIEQRAALAHLVRGQEKENQ